MSTKKRLTHFAVVLFPQFEPLDVFGPLELLTFLSRQKYPNEQSPACPEADFTDLVLSIIAYDLRPVSTAPSAPSRLNNLFGQSVVPTHTFDNPPADIDVLIVPGGFGTRLPQGGSKTIPALIAFIADVFPRIQYLFTVCTGAGLAARAGVLDGHKATTNKAAWSRTVPLGRKTHWLASKRWVDSGKVWTTAGVSAGTDGMLAFIEKFFGKEIADDVAFKTEYYAAPSDGDGRFAEHYKCEDVLPETQ